MKRSLITTASKNVNVLVFVSSIFEKLCASFLLATLLYHFVFPQYALASSSPLVFPYDDNLKQNYLIAQEQKRQALAQLALLEVYKKNASERYHVLTAYSSTVWQTDDSPFITASGSRVREGIVAANSLPFGTKILIPELFGDRVFTVEDRMAPKNYHKIDIWFPSTEQAFEFGVKKAKVVVLPAEASAVLH